jgi:SAM-dependent methyltransferase
MSNEHVCPWWIGFPLASPARRLVQNPESIVEPFVKNNMRVLEIGPGMGFFTLAMAVAHEVPDRKRLFEEIHAAMKTGGKVLIADPVGHFSGEEFERALSLAEAAGFRRSAGPRIRRCLSAVLTETPEG